MPGNTGSNISLFGPDPEGWTADASQCEILHLCFAALYYRPVPLTPVFLPAFLPAFLIVLSSTLSASAQQSMPLWPAGFLKSTGPDAVRSTGPERDTNLPTDPKIAGRPIIKLTDVTEPELTLYTPHSTANTGAAVLVFPGGGYRILAYDLEGTEVCTWLNSLGVNCVLVKYRVPYDGHYPEELGDLEDAQRAMRLTRQHAAEWQIDPHRIGVLGFSAGAHLAAVLSIHPAQTTYSAVDAADKLDARPDFAVILYPGYLAAAPALTALSPGVEPTASTPPTFVLQAEDDPVHQENALRYYRALKEAKVPAELHIFAEGGHGYGLRPTNLPVTHWPALAETWFHTIHVLPKPERP